MVVTVSHAGYVKRSPLTEYRSQRRGGRGKTGASMKEDDFVSDLFVASTHAYLMPITTRGKLYWLKVHEIPAASRTARGKPIINVVQMGEGEKLASILVTKSFEEDAVRLLRHPQGRREAHGPQRVLQRALGRASSPSGSTTVTRWSPSSSPTGPRTSCSPPRRA